MASDNTPGFFSRLGSGFGAFFRGFKFINDHKLWKYIIFPSILSTLLGIGLMFGAYFYVSEWLAGLIGNSESFLVSLLKWFMNIFVFVISFVITLFLYRSLASIVVIPFLGPLLSKVEVILTGKAVEVSIGKDIKNALVGLWVGIKYLLLEILFLLFSFFAGPLQPFVMVLVSGYFLGRGTFDYLLEKHSQTLKERKERAKAFWPEMEGLGVAHVMILFIPVIGVFIAPGSSLVGAALLFYDE